MLFSLWRGLEFLATSLDSFQGGDPPWTDIVGDPKRRRAYDDASWRVSRAALTHIKMSQLVLKKGRGVVACLHLLGICICNEVRTLSVKIWIWRKALILTLFQKQKIDLYLNGEIQIHRKKLGPK